MLLTFEVASFGPIRKAWESRHPPFRYANAAIVRRMLNGRICNVRSDFARLRGFRRFGETNCEASTFAHRATADKSARQAAGFVETAFACQNARVGQAAKELTQAQPA